MGMILGSVVTFTLGSYAPTTVEADFGLKLAGPRLPTADLAGSHLT
jgi:hypothetical protein